MYMKKSRNYHFNAPIATKVVCFSRLLKCLRSLYVKQCGPRSDCFYIGAVCSGSTLFLSILNFGSNVRQLFAADDFSRRHFQMHFFLGAVRVKLYLDQTQQNTRPDLDSNYLVCLKKLSEQPTKSKYYP